jgi:3-hydroxy-D-aspartate aldolase
MNLENYEVGYNIPAKIGTKLKDIQTPCLIVDYDIFENNIHKMKNFILNNNVKLRPHAKMHKSINVAEYQINFGGAHGICCQKVSEAEVFARGGIKNILVTNQITDQLKINRLTSISQNNVNIGCCVDNEDNIVNINNSAEEKNTSIDIYIEFDCGANRCGVQSFEEIEKLILLINSLDFVNFIGFQAYNGSIQHIEDFEIRKREVHITCNKIKELKKHFEQFSPFITGVGTGCFDLEVSENVYDEIQVGSYAFMDAHYSSLKHNEKINNTNYFENSLFVLSSVMSVALDKHAIVDAGLKSIAVDSGLPKTLMKDIKYIKCSDEHGIIYDPKNSFKINDKLFLVPGHCDPTCNLHDWYVILKDGKVKDLWPVSARGYSY